MLHRPLALIALIALPAQASAAQNPIKRTEELVKAFRAVKPIPDDGSDLSAADRKSNASAFGNLDSFFDWDALTNSSIDTHKAKFKPTQLKEFHETLRELIRLVAYPGGGAFLSEATYKLKLGQRQKAKQADVDMFAELEAEDLETTVTFHWREVAGSLRIVDVSFDGASLVRDYRNQFGRIIAKSGVDGLLGKLRKRLDKEREDSVL